MKLPTWYTTPTAQVMLVGITCFATVGMFSAVSNLGAGGTQDIALSDTSNGVLYGFFAVTGLVSGGICNCTYTFDFCDGLEKLSKTLVLGPRLTLFLGSLGYALYVGALWWYNLLSWSPRLQLINHTASRLRALAGSSSSPEPSWA